MSRRCPRVQFSTGPKEERDELLKDVKIDLRLSKHLGETQESKAAELRGQERAA